MRRAVFFCSVLLLVSLSRTAAQEPGRRIRFQVDATRSQWVVGTLLGQDRDSLLLLVAGEVRPVSLARSAVRRLQVSRGHSRAVVEGLAAGSGLGVLVGVNAAGKEASSACTDGIPGICALETEADLAHAALAAGVIGGVVGAAVGFAVRTERWEAVW